MKIDIVFQRVEGFFLLVLSVVIYFLSDFHWIPFVLLFFVFDLSFIGYVFNKKMGAIVYNLGHSFILPSLCGIAFLLVRNDWILALTSLWFAHIGFDRAAGFGLKTIEGFKYTHPGTIGKSRKISP